MSSLGKWKIGRTLGSGASCKVKLAVHSETGQQAAIKLLNDGMDAKMKELVDVEVKALAALKHHQNILHQIEYGIAPYAKGQKSKEKKYIALELAEGGELFDVIAISGRFPEPLARYFFKQFMEGLHYCHEKGITHRDLKPENLLLDKDNILKIADFGFAGPTSGRDGSGYLKTKLGTTNYMAPEIHLRQPYVGSQVDLFSAAIILFIMVAQHPPFTAAVSNDPFYRTLASGRAGVFWHTHCKHKEGGDNFFSEEFKDLITAMLTLDPANRPDMMEICSHKWMQGPTPSPEEVAIDFAKRMKVVKAQMEADKKQKEIEKAQASQATGNPNAAACRAGGVDLSWVNWDEWKGGPKKTMEEYGSALDNPFGQMKTQFLSNINADLLETILVNYLKNQMQTEVKLSDSKYKLQFTMRDGKRGQETMITCRIWRYDKENVLLDFTKNDGDQTQFLDHFKEVRDDFNISQLVAVEE